MARYDHGYDYGLRGRMHTSPPPREVHIRRAPGPWRDEAWPPPRSRGYDDGWRGMPSLPRRVTAAYNRDYLRAEPSPPRFNPVPYGGDVPGRFAEPDEYGYAYRTMGGSRTSRGASGPLMGMDGRFGGPMPPPRGYDEPYRMQRPVRRRPR